MAPTSIKRRSLSVDAGKCAPEIPGCAFSLSLFLCHARRETRMNESSILTLETLKRIVRSHDATCMLIALVLNPHRALTRALQMHITRIVQAVPWLFSFYHRVFFRATVLRILFTIYAILRSLRTCSWQFPSFLSERPSWTTCLRQLCFPQRIIRRCLLGSQKKKKSGIIND